MDPQSPPKRMTRARAAAKVTEPATKTTKVVTAAARAKTTRTTTTTSTKRKTRSDDVEDSDNDEQDIVITRELPAAAMKTTKATRGRAKKPVEEVAPEPEAAPVRTRGRPRKVVVEPATEEPVKTTRTSRTRKTVAEETEELIEPPKRATRGRPPSSMATRTVAKPTVKKTVKFEEPEKENMVPPNVGTVKASGKVSESATGLRAKPVRKASTATGRTARGTKASAATGERPIPLSPKKVNQMLLNRTDSDDELAPNDKVSARPLRKNPIRPALSNNKPLHEPPIPNEHAAPEPSEIAPVIILGSPAKKLPQSPWKGSIRSPAKRVEGVLGISSTQTLASDESSSASLKASLLQSPAKRPPSGMKGLDLGAGNGAQLGVSPFKTSLLLSPAKRSFSPVKTLLPQSLEEEPIEASPAPKATLLATPLPPVANNGAETAIEDTDVMALDKADDDGIPDSPTRLRFPGRLSAVLPRHADPALTTTTATPVVPEVVAKDAEDEDPDRTLEEESENEEYPGDPMALDEPQAETQELGHAERPIASVSPLNPVAAMFGLRYKDLRDSDSEAECGSEDELAPRRTLFPSAFTVSPATPSLESSSRTPKARAGDSKMNSTGRSPAKRVRMDTRFGFTPLAEQLSGWTAGPSPLKTGIIAESPIIAAPAAVLPAVGEPSPTRTTFFDEAMAVQPEPIPLEAQPEATETPEPASPVLEDIPITEEDMALAAEAHEMSLMEPAQAEELAGSRSFDDSISEASQEYGDENEVPVDPTLLGPAADSGEAVVPLATPRRPLHREFHTVSKVPLKPADDSSPQLKIKKRGHSISRLPVARPTHGLTRNATVISYSPTKNRDENPFEVPEENRRAGSVPPVTPTKSEAGWSMAGTPARTPRRDLDPALLKGAVVFVDVHTSEGADASGIFVELLTQMGARCVKSWPWNPTSPPGNDGSSSKIGITHVVYKDGGKRTLEKVRESGGVVQCVGVSWVLDCERENQWLDEVPYYIDTSMVPRGGARRRKSMEPRAIANLNGMLVPTPVRHGSGASRGSQSVPSTPANGRRASALWIRTPEDNGGEEDADGDFVHDDMEWSGILTPVPKTPAPEAIARYAANLTPATPSDSPIDGQDPVDDDDDGDARRAAMMTRTCPPKPTAFLELGEGILSREKDEHVLLRLMAARRKSLQFAPKVASPLSKTWK